ncbi:NADH-quinone oxidoreductase subunit L, partial [Myxococcota bacterium]|nr:NADH-quinone oxidoreductase subunit L [Myxococcota bacterium]
VGAATAIVAASIGTAQRDIKKVLAYSTVSQLGFMFIAAGIGAYAIAIFHLATHAFFKALLFLGSGSVIHGMSGEQDMRHMGGLWRKMPITFVTFLIATLAITGIVPGLSGFISKDAILWNAWVADHGAYASTFASFGKVIWVTGFLAAGLTSYYMWRLVFMTFFSGELRASEEVKHHVHESSYWMTIPLMLLAVLAFFGGAIGWPHIFGGHEWIVEWLVPIAGHSPVPEGNHVFVESMLMVVSVGIGLVGFAVAFYLYGKRIHPFTTRFSSERPYRWLHLRLLDKWHVDELYEVMIINPLRWFSDVVLYNIFDRWIIDGTVNLVGWLARTLGFFGQL